MFPKFMKLVLKQVPRCQHDCKCLSECILRSLVPRHCPRQVVWLYVYIHVHYHSMPTMFTVDGATCDAVEPTSTAQIDEPTATVPVPDPSSTVQETVGGGRCTAHLDTQISIIIIHVHVYTYM